MLPRLNSSQLFERLLTLFSLFCCNCRFLLLTHFLYPCVTYLYLSLLFSALLRRWLSVHGCHRCEEDTLLFPSTICSTSNVASASIICLSSMFGDCHYHYPSLLDLWRWQSAWRHCVITVLRSSPMQRNFLSILLLQTPPHPSFLSSFASWFLQINLF